MSTVIPVGARVHHRGCLWNYHFNEQQRQKQPSWGWATVQEAVEQRDGTCEYRVLKDAPFSSGLNVESWWASYHIDRWEESD